MNTKQLFTIISLLIFSLVIIAIDNDDTVAMDNNSVQNKDWVNSPVDEIDSTDEDESETIDYINPDQGVAPTDESVEVTSYYQTLESNQLSYLTVDSRMVPLQIKQIDINYSKGVENKPEYLVIHETNNWGVGADANAHYRYWSTNDQANASTHFVVDDFEIYQMLQFDQAAWHVGDNKGHSDITNVNSIGIEIAVNADGDYEKARQNSIELTINVMNYLEMDISQLVRHYDASGKWCPKEMLDDPSLWDDYVAQVAAGLNQ